jgi:hypothetical protein
MKFIPTLLIFTSFAVAQEIQQVPAEQAIKVAHKITSALGSPADAPFAVDADADKPSGLKAGGDAGVLAIPDKKLTAESPASAGKEILPLGQLWMRNVVPAVNNAAPDPATLRTVKVAEGDKEVTVEVYFLGITKTDSGVIELGLYSKDRQPLVKTPLVKTDTAASTTPIALDGRKEGENSGVLVISVFGSYKAEVAVTKPRE